MTNDEVRQYFKDKGLTYKDITNDDIKVLRSYLRKEIAISIKNDKNFCASVSLKPGMKQSKYDENGKLKQCFIRVRAHYYNSRECISFNPDGFIGFAGWADEHHLTPFRTAFILWCDWMKEVKKDG